MNIIILTYAKDNLKVASINRLIEEAQGRGHSLERVRYNECSMTVEHGIPKIYYRGQELKDIDTVIPWIIQDELKYGMDVLRHFEYAGAFVLNDANAIANACDKWQTIQILIHGGIPIPDTYRTAHNRDMYQFVNGMSSNKAIIKIPSGTRGKGVILSPNKNMTKSITDTLGVLRNDYVIQEFIEESRGVDIRAYVVGGQVVASMERRSDHDFRSNLWLGGKGVKVILNTEETDLAIKAAHILGLRVAGIDIIRSNSGPLIIEANASAGFGIEKITDCNVASKIIEYIENNAKRRNKKDKVGA